MNNYAQLPGTQIPPLKPSYTYTVLNPFVTVDNKEYQTFRGSDGKVFYKKDNKYVEIKDKDTEKAILNNRKVSYVLDKKQALTQPTATPAPKTTPSSGGGGGGGTWTDPALTKALRESQEQQKVLQAKLEELLIPKVYTNKELADIYGLEDLYNESNLLKIRDEATEDYYGKAIAEQDKLRTQAAGYNSQWLTSMLNDYLTSTQHSTPTATNRGANFANALMTDMNANLLNADNDLGMMQSVDALGQNRLSELELNKAEAMKQYNTIGAYLQSVGADMNKSDVQAYAGQLGSMADMYASQRQYQSALAQAAATRYQGQASAAGIRAQAAGAAHNSSQGRLEQLWNAIYQTNNQNADYAYNLVGNQLMGGQVR